MAPAIEVDNIITGRYVTMAPAIEVSLLDDMYSCLESQDKKLHSDTTEGIYPA